MGDAAFGMTGLDFETAVRSDIPITTDRAQQLDHGDRDARAWSFSHEKYRTRDIGGSYADIAQAMGGWAERVEHPEEVAGAFPRARKANEGGRAALLEFITSEETAFSHRGALR